MGDHNTIKSFWQNYSDSPNIQTMMLNKNAELFDETDRRDIWMSLPDLTGLRIVEIGSGIGRFTAALASVAKHVLATDFVESFIERNKEIHGHLVNVNFKCADAINVDLNAESCDLVFTNWLLMYLTDAEVVQFLSNVLVWLTPNGYLHFRESCSESSKRSKTDDNPTRYRHISQYLTLLERLRVKDPTNNELMHFEVLWAKSVETYIQLPSEKAVPNWRQIHMLLRKVSSNDLNGFTYDQYSLVNYLNRISIDAKDQFERDMKCRRELWNGRSPFEILMLEYLKNYYDKGSRNSALTLFWNNTAAISPFAIAEAFQCNVLDVNTCLKMYDYNLAQANAKGDQRLRFQFIPSLVQGNTNGWQYIQQHYFDVVIGCLLSSSVENFVDTVYALLEKAKPDGRVILLEKCEDIHTLLSTKIQNHDGLNVKVDVQLVTDEIKNSLSIAIMQVQHTVELQAIRHQYDMWLNEKSMDWYIISIQLKDKAR